MLDIPLYIYSTPNACYTLFLLRLCNVLIISLTFPVTRR